MSDEVVRCVCRPDCGKVLSADQVRNGNKFAWGHKPKVGRAGMPVGDGARRAPGPGAVSSVGYAATAAMVEANLAALHARNGEVGEELNALRAENLRMVEVREKLEREIGEHEKRLHPAAE